MALLRTIFKEYYERPEPGGVCRSVEELRRRARAASAERTLVDLADRPDLAGGWPATVRLIDRLRGLDLDSVVEYTRALGNSTTAAKVGWYLTTRREALGVGEGHLAALAVLKPGSPTTSTAPAAETAAWWPTGT